MQTKRDLKGSLHPSLIMHSLIKGFRLVDFRGWRREHKATMPRASPATVVHIQLVHAVGGEKFIYQSAFYLSQLSSTAENVQEKESVCTEYESGD